MSAETMKKIFDPFFSTKGAWAKDNLGITGTGLGLSVSHAIIKQHNGLITVESEEGEGTTFIIKLPMPEVKDIKLIKWKTESHDLNNVKTRDLKIMVIDDEEEMISLMKLIFNKIGFRNYLTEKSSIHAIETFQKFNPDVVFLDLLMPGLNGEQVLEKIKSINSAVPVVFMSGKLDLEEHEYKNKGAFDFIKKPFNVNNIFDVLDKVAEQKR
jgi:CheY-like chemotaxis protein